MKLSVLAAVVGASMLTAFSANAVPPVSSQLGLQMETKFRALLKKEEAKLAMNRSRGDSSLRSSATECGSQTIGATESGTRRVGNPSQVFVYAPNAVNICQH